MVHAISAHIGTVLYSLKVHTTRSFATILGTFLLVVFVMLERRDGWKLLISRTQILENLGKLLSRRYGVGRFRQWLFMTPELRLILEEMQLIGNFKIIFDFRNVYADIAQRVTSHVPYFLRASG